jgi:hypothetical protein
MVPKDGNFTESSIRTHLTKQKSIHQKDRQACKLPENLFNAYELERAVAQPKARFTGKDIELPAKNWLLAFCSHIHSAKYCLRYITAS